MKEEEPGFHPLPSGLGTDNVVMKLLFVSSLKVKSPGDTWGYMEAFRKAKGPSKFQVLVLWSLNPEDFNVKMTLLFWNRPEAWECANPGLGQSDRERSRKTAPQPLPLALHPCCSLTPVLFEMRQEMGNWVVGPVDA